MKHASLVLAVALGAAAAPGLVLADEIEGTVLAYDRVAKVLVLRDKTVIPLDVMAGELPEDLVAGDRVDIVFDSNEDTGVSMVHSITRID